DGRNTAVDAGMQRPASSPVPPCARPARSSAKSLARAQMKARKNVGMRTWMNDLSSTSTLTDYPGQRTKPTRCHDQLLPNVECPLAWTKTKRGHRGPIEPDDRARTAWQSLIIPKRYLPQAARRVSIDDFTPGNSPGRPCASFSNNVSCSANSSRHDFTSTEITCWN